MYRRLRTVVAVLVVIFTFFLGFAGYMWWQWASGAKEEVSTKPAPVLFTVERGDSVQTIGERLEKQGIVRSALAFRYLGRAANPKPGTYYIAASEPPRTILSRLDKGDVATVRVTFPEGWTVQQMAKRLKKSELVADEAAFLKLVTENGKSLNAGFPTPNNLEGYLFPDTYFFPLRATDQQIAETMLRNFHRRVVEGLSKELQQTSRPLSEIVTVASMIEREAELDTDRPLIAGVIYNRLQKGMRLQIDATVQYARGVHENRLLYRHLEVDSPYNTYKNTGLPPGPICCPGLPSIKAAAQPEPSNFLFYVDAGLGTGKHLFAAIYGEHQRNVALFRQRRRAAQKAESKSTR
ncbi:MAG: endolytic transglycosylase MltG [Armatimonadaceae bacterium]